MMSKPCKHCGKSFPYCTGCDWDWLSELGYCSIECGEHDNLVLKTKISFAVLLNGLTDEQKIYLATIIDNYEVFSSAGVIDDIVQFVDRYRLDPEFLN